MSKDFVDYSTTFLDRLYCLTNNSIDYEMLYSRFGDLTPVKKYARLYICWIRKYAQQLLNNVVDGTGQL